MGLPDQNQSAGAEVQKAGKSITCKVKAQTADAQTSICMLFGGREPIPDGVVAVMRVKIAPDARPGPARIRVDQAIAVRKDTSKTEMKPVEAVVHIRK